MSETFVAFVCFVVVYSGQNTNSVRHSARCFVGTV
jgi:hypothetical protein